MFVIIPIGLIAAAAIAGGHVVKDKGPSAVEALKDTAPVVAAAATANVRPDLLAQDVATAKSVGRAVGRTVGYVVGEMRGHPEPAVDAPRVRVTEVETAAPAERTRRRRRESPALPAPSRALVPPAPFVQSDFRRPRW
jgi:hypothetical protein